MKLDALIAFTQDSYRNMKISYFSSKLIEHDKNK